VALIAASLLVAGSAAAEPVRDATRTPGEAVAAVGAGLDLSVPSLQARAKKLEADASPDGGASDALRDYEAAIDQLELAAEWHQRGEALARLQRDGTRMIDQARKEIDAWSQPLTAAPGGDASRAQVEAMLAEDEAKLAVVRKGLLDADAEQAQLAERRLSLPAELAAAGATREGI